MLCTLAIVLAVRSAHRQMRTAMPIPQDDRLLHEASARAQASIDAMRPHIGTHLQTGVKFPLRNAAGDIEHVWATPEAMDDTIVTARVVTPFVDGALPDDPVAVPLAEIEDWQVFLDDGRILGGYGTRAQMAIARRDGHPIPGHVLAQEARFVDA